MNENLIFIYNPLIIFFSIILISLLPLPTLPVIIYGYKKLSFHGAFLCIILASNIAILLQYNIGIKISEIKHLRFLRNGRIKKISDNLRKTKLSDLIFLRLSNLFLSKIMNYSLGFIKYPIKNLLIINNISLILWQFPYYYMASKIDILSIFFKRLNLDVNTSLFLSIISLSAILILTLRIVFYILIKLNLFNISNVYKIAKK